MRKESPRKPQPSNLSRPFDPDLKDVLEAIYGLDPATIHKKSNDLVGASTIYNWRAGKVRRPQHYTMQAALRAAGLRFYIGKTNR